jgi:uncharacterized protein YyaL (SSP411 family)
MNHLATETSPYLLQHNDNPVEWHIWTAETLAKAKAADKPLLLSIGYAACHWCHVIGSCVSFYLTGKPKYRDLAESQIGAFAGEAVRNPVPLASFLSSIDCFLNSVQILIRAGARTEWLLRAVQECCVPNRVLSVLKIGEEAPKGHPAKGKTNISDLATAYVCVGDTCSLPVTDPQILRSVLSNARASNSSWGQ